MQCLLLRLECRCAREAFCHPAFMGNCTTISYTVSLIYLVDEFFFLFLVYLNKMRTLAESKVLSFLFLVLIRWNEEEMWVQDLLLLPQGFENFLWDLERVRWRNLMCVCVCVCVCVCLERLWMIKLMVIGFSFIGGWCYSGWWM